MENDIGKTISDLVTRANHNEIVEPETFLMAEMELNCFIKDYYRKQARDRYATWFKNRSENELKLQQMAIDFEEKYFSDMRLLDYENQILKFEYSSNNVSISDDIEEYTELEMFESSNEISNELTIANWIFKIVPDNGEFVAQTKFYERTIEVTESYKDDISAILHEMTHAYEDLLKEVDTNYYEFVIMKLFENLLPILPNLQELIAKDTHSLRKVHSILFSLKSLKLDYELGLELGTVFGYGREELFKD